MRPVNSSRNSKDTEIAAESFIHKALVNTTEARACGRKKQIGASCQMEHDGAFDDMHETK